MKGVFKIILAGFLIGAAVWGSARLFLNSPSKTKKPIATGGYSNSIKQPIQQSQKNLSANITQTPSDEQKETSAVNILLLGMSGDGYEAPYLTDTILLLSISSDSQVTMFSLPRDFYVKVPEIENFGNYANYYTKINALYQLGKISGSETAGAELIKTKVEQITGLKIDNYAIMDLDGLEGVVDQIGGLNVFVENDVFDPRFPTKNFGTEIFELKKGWRWLDGRNTLRYVRTRHDIEGDFGRIKRQQAVLEALRKKIAGMNPFWDLPKIIDIVMTLKQNLRTNAGILDVKRLWSLSRAINSSKISRIAIDANIENGLLTESTAILGGKTGFILVPKSGVENYEEIQKFIKNNLE